MDKSLRATIDPESLTVSRTSFTNADLASAWAALTDPLKIIEWFGDRARIDAVEVGAHGMLGWDTEGDFPIEIVEVDEPHVFAFRWAFEPEVAVTISNSTLVRFTLSNDAAGTRIDLAEAGFALVDDHGASPRARAEANREGWDEELDELVAWLDSGL